MEKIKKIDFLLITFVLLGLRAVIIEPSVGYAFTSFGFASIIGFNKWLAENKKQDVSAELKKEIEDLRNNVSGIMIKNASKPQQMAQQQTEVRRFF